MSRSGYSDAFGDEWSLIRWRGAVLSAIRGARGQLLILELLEALEAIPEKRLIAEELATAIGEYCALGVLGAKRGIDLDTLDPEDYKQVASAFGVANALVREIVWENDEFRWGNATPEQRWQHMCDWCRANLKAEVAR